MHPITLPVSELKPALAGLGKIIVNKSTLPVIKTLKIERTPDGWICLTATDLDRFVTVRLEQPTKGEPLSLLITFEELSKLTKSSNKGDSIHLESSAKEDVILRFNLGDQLGETKVQSFPLQEFPAIPRIQANPVPVNESFRLALHEAMACSSTDESRYVLNGACIDVSQPKAHYLVGTDGRHLFSSNSFNLPFQKSIIIPKHKFLGWKDFNLDGAWQMKLSDASDGKNQLLQISSRRWRFITRLIEGNYPNWRQVIPNPREAKTILTLDPDKLDAVIQLIERMPNHDEQYHTLGIEYQGMQCRLVYKSTAEAPWTHVPLPHCKAEGKPVTIFVDRRLLLKALQFGLSTIGIIGELSPLRFYLGGRQIIVMPVRPDGPASSQPKAPAPSPRETPIPAFSPSPTPPERKHQPMPNNHQPEQQPSELTPAATLIEQAITVVDEIRVCHLQSNEKLRDLGTKLRNIQRSQKSGTKEMQTLRQHHRGLQSMRI
ncbi:DNA polymerase III sliding clamp (beta) subunit (PCNA family) [Roseimicrobium gellanilyticum]|uniref:Beta sliding clamp n=1 Tax=Roseimicrobium gellanilyticum TaxID=748857 RepID=A0A366HHB4_9BACT|nr:DNA polymerase III subunit beta [Roseimicrobium gellanilyticum]RBP41450.1 DNA polymerase III sliding clamp (beta) subunit (PCNA family) [Roseimicrobium gellanilyticum]